MMHKKNNIAVFIYNLILLIGFIPINLFCQEWTIDLTVIGNTANEEIIQTRTFGGDSTATNGYDAGLDIITPPSSQVFHTYFKILEFPYSLEKDIREWASPYKTDINWFLHIENTAASNINRITIKWDSLAFPVQGHFGLNEIDMKEQSSYESHGDTILQIQYTLPVYTLSIGKNPEEGGTTSPEAGIHSYDFGDTVNVTAFPAESYEFIKWTGDVEDSTSSTTSVLMNSDKIITANFRLNSSVDLQKDKMIPISNFSLMQNYPNPFNPETIITYQIPNQCHVSICIYNLWGQEIVRMFEGRQIAGIYTIKWDGTDNTSSPVASGVYVIFMQAGHFREIRKLIVAR
jgi:hypothetical protein